MATPTVYVICDQNCKFESLTKEQIISLIAEATGNSVTNVDDAFVTKIKEQNAGAAIKLWVGTQAEYNQLVSAGNVDANTIYCTTDESMLTVLRDAVVDLEVLINDVDNKHTAFEKTLGTVAKKNTVPVSMGGTGATTAEAARRQLGFSYTSQEIVLDDYGAADVECDYGVGGIEFTPIIFTQVVSANGATRSNVSTKVVTMDDGFYRVLITSDSTSLNAGATITLNCLVIIQEK